MDIPTSSSNDINSRVITWSAPAGETPSDDFHVEVNDTPVFVYQAKVRQATINPPDSILTHEMGCESELASFVNFDFTWMVRVKITPNRAFQTATVHPLMLKKFTEE